MEAQEEQQPQSEGNLLIGAGISLLFGILLVAMGFEANIGPVFWNIMMIAFGLPVAAGSLILIWKRSGKKAMVRGAITIFIIGCMVAIGVIIWFISVLNSLGG